MAEKTANIDDQTVVTEPVEASENKSEVKKEVPKKEAVKKENKSGDKKEEQRPKDEPQVEINPADAVNLAPEKEEVKKEEVKKEEVKKETSKVAQALSDVMPGSIIAAVHTRVHIRPDSSSPFKVMTGNFEIVNADSTFIHVKYIKHGFGLVNGFICKEDIVK